jgi:stalled ribosome rescue protein Dom34
MPMSYHTCVWIDHREAKIFEIAATDVITSHVKDDRPHHHIHRKANHVGFGTEPTDPVMLDEIAEKLRGAKAILIVGPGKAKTDLKSFLENRHAQIGRNVWDVQASDHPSDAELVASARSWFRAQDRLR